MDIFETSSAGRALEVLQQSGSSWTATTAPLPGDNATGQHRERRRAFCSEWVLGVGLSCATGSCEAVGRYTTTSGGHAGFARQPEWRHVDVGRRPAAVQCADGRHRSGEHDRRLLRRGRWLLWASGQYHDASGNDHSLVETVTSGAPSGQEAPQPSDAAGTPSAALIGVSCLSADACTAVGVYHDNSGSGNNIGYFDTLSGGTWSSVAGSGSRGRSNGDQRSVLARLHLVHEPRGVRCRGVLQRRIWEPAGPARGLHAPRGLLDRRLRRWDLHLRQRGVPRIDGRPAPQRAHGGHGRDPRARWLLGGGLRRRDLQLRQRRLPRLDGQPAPEQARRGHGGHPRRGRLLAGGLRRGDLQLRRRRLLRLGRVDPAQQADRGHGGHPRRPRLLAGGLRRRDLHLRRRQLLRLHAAASRSTSPSSAWPPTPAGSATGWSPPTAGSSPTATPASTARRGASCSTSPSSA